MSVSRFIQRSRKFRAEAGKIVSSKDPREVNKRSQGKSPTEPQGLSKAARRRKGKKKTTRNADVSCLGAPRSDTTQRSLQQCRARKMTLTQKFPSGDTNWSPLALKPSTALPSGQETPYTAFLLLVCTKITRNGDLSMIMRPIWRNNLHLNAAVTFARLSEWLSTHNTAISRTR